MRSYRRILANVALITFFVFTVELFLEPVAKAKWFEDEIDPEFLAVVQQGLDDFNGMRTLHTFVEKAPSALNKNDKGLTTLLHSLEPSNFREEETKEEAAAPKPGFLDRLRSRCIQGYAGAMQWFANRDGEERLDDATAALLGKAAIGIGEWRVRKKAASSWQCIKAQMIDPALRKFPNVALFSELILDGTRIMAGNDQIARIVPAKSGSLPAFQFGESGVVRSFDRLLLDLTHPTKAEENLFDLVAQLKTTQQTKDASLFKQWIGIKEAEAGPSALTVVVVALVLIAIVSLLIGFVAYHKGYVDMLIEDVFSKPRDESGIGVGPADVEENEPLEGGPSGKALQQELYDALVEQQVSDGLVVRETTRILTSQDLIEDEKRTRLDALGKEYLGRIKQFVEDHPSAAEKYRQDRLEIFYDWWDGVNERYSLLETEQEFAKLLFEKPHSEPVYYDLGYILEMLEDLFDSTSNVETRQLIAQRLQASREQEDAASNNNSWYELVIVSDRIFGKLDK